ncbi:MAG: efflux RND transporter periplasmic adaptor subunit [Vicinamibacteria bacterium]
MKTKTKILIAGSVVALTGAGFAFSRRGPKPTEVEVATVGREDLQAKVTANGKVQARKKVDISATIPGQITHLAVKEGDPVKKGQFLLQIDATNPRASARSSEFSMEALRQDQQSARANLEQARADLKRAEDNYASRIISDADMERARTAVATAQAAADAAGRRIEQAGATLEGARDTLAKTTVRSPIDGVVTAKRVEEGEVAVIGIQNSPGTVLLQVSDMSSVETELEVDETSVPSLALGQEARIRIDAYPNQTFKGEVTEVGGSPILPAAGSNQNAIKFLVKVLIKDPPNGVKPGLSVQADILTGFRAQALVVPIQALVIRDREKKPGDAATGTPKDEEGVFLLENGKARFQPLQTGLLGELSLEVVSGLKGGETLIVGPFKSLRELKPDDAVKPEEKKKEDAPRAS